MRVAIATVQVPFVRGGAEILAEGLRDALLEAGHQAAIVAVPFQWNPPARILDHILASRLLDLERSSGVAIDRVIGLKFPAYLVPHSNKVLWIVHQHRSAYELWEHSLGDLIHYPDGTLVRDAIHEADRRFMPEARRVYGISATVTRRLAHHCGISARTLYHPPPGAEHLRAGEPGPYFFFPSRLWPTKRQALVIDALRFTSGPVAVRFAGVGDDPDYAATLARRAADLGVADRVAWLGSIPAEQLRRQYASALAVVYPPADEDYGYVTLEAMIAGKAVVTCSDSGGPLEFVAHGETGLVVEPDARDLARALDELWHDRGRARRFGTAGRERYDALEISWPRVVEELLA